MLWMYNNCISGIKKVASNVGSLYLLYARDIDSDVGVGRRDEHEDEVK